MKLKWALLFTLHCLFNITLTVLTSIDAKWLLIRPNRTFVKTGVNHIKGILALS